jgi:D-alanyl-D-alanine carboxypeptidase
VRRAFGISALCMLGVPTGAFGAALCDAGPAEAAAVNAASLFTLAWAPYHRPETGWATYAPRIAAEIGTACPAESPGFAAALTSWQARFRLKPSGLVDASTYAAMNARWHRQRPFAGAAAHGGCPEPPDASLLAVAAPTESYGGKTIQLRADALAAYRKLVAAARPALAGGDPDWLTIFSGFRAPDADAERCAADGNCDGVVRAVCSPHRTGYAIDIHVGHGEGMRPDSSDDANRRAMTQTPVYAWLVANAAQFGFVNYVFEPWHWEWGEAVASAQP